MKMFLLIDNYDSFTYNLKALFELEGEKVNVIKNNEYLVPKQYEGIILSPGPSSPENSGTTLEFLRRHTGQIPFFGVCLGMQAICFSQNYEIRKAYFIMHGKKDIIFYRENSVLFNGLKEPFSTVRYHSLVVKNLDKNSKEVTALSKSDNEIMAYENIEKKLFGVQFHPESYLSEVGNIIVKNFIKFCRS
jgi:anthranilate synthase component 2